MKAKLIRQAMDRVGPTPEHCTLEWLEDRHLISSLLVAKLHEEAQEVSDARTRAEMLAELCDVYEVLHTLATLHGHTMAEVERRARDKADERGPLLSSDRFGVTRALLLKRDDEP